METQGQDPNTPSHAQERSEPVRSRWTPKPEQILILESIFNSGMVNPPKDETVRIRKLLEKFGAVGDANVFYWFQNRRSRSRRRQRQMQAASMVQEQRSQPQVGGGAIQYECSSGVSGFGASVSFTSTPSSYLVGSGSSSSCGLIANESNSNLFPATGQMGFPEIEQNPAVTSMLFPIENQNMQYHAGFVTVFINGVPTEVPSGPIDVKAMFGQDVMLVHSSGVVVPINEFGFLVQSLEQGESYYLVPRPT